MNSERSAMLKRMGLMVLMTNFLSGFALTMAQNYASYSYTDLAHIPPATMSLCMTIVNTIAVVISLTSGAMITATRSKMGNFRPWFLFANIACLIGGFLLFFNVGDSIVVKAIVISIGYLMANSCMDFVYTARAALQAGIAGPDSEARNMMQGRQWQGANACLVVSGLIVIPLVRLLGQGNETRGFLLTQSIFTVSVMIGTIWMFMATKKFDPDNRHVAADNKEKVNFWDMIKAVVVNREAVTVILSDVVRFTGYFVMMYIMVYQCTYVIGDMLAMSYVLSASAIVAILGNTLAPIVAPKLGGRKKTIAVFGLLTALGFSSIGLFGKTLWGFVISMCFGFFFMSFIDTLDAMLYMDAGEIWLQKTGKDTRPYLISMYNISVKIAMALSTVVLGILLSAMHYVPDTPLDVAGKTMMTWSTGLAPGIGYGLPILIMLFHRVPDHKMNDIIKENAEKYGVKEE